MAFNPAFLATVPVRAREAAFMEVASRGTMPSVINREDE